MSGQCELNYLGFYFILPKESQKKKYIFICTFLFCDHFFFSGLPKKGAMLTLTNHQPNPVPEAHFREKIRCGEVYRNLNGNEMFQKFYYRCLECSMDFESSPEFEEHVIGTCNLKPENYRKYVYRFSFSSLFAG